MLPCLSEEQRRVELVARSMSHVGSTGREHRPSEVTPPSDPCGMHGGNRQGLAASPGPIKTPGEGAIWETSAQFQPVCVPEPEKIFSRARNSSQTARGRRRCIRID